MIDRPDSSKKTNKGTGYLYIDIIAQHFKLAFMRKPRLIGSETTSHYHCVSRIVDRRRIFGTAEKGQFVKMMRRVARYTGVRVLTYCVMENHFHLLLEIRREGSVLRPSLGDLLSGIEALYGRMKRREVEQELAAAKKSGDKDWEEGVLTPHIARRADLSVFMKLLKQRFSIWYNRHNERTGTLWEERFRSVLVESTPHALTAVAAYIDLNPVRAKLVADPKEWCWSGYGEAVAGSRAARNGLLEMICPGQDGSWKDAGSQYRMLLYQSAIPQEGTGGRLGGILSAEAISEVIESGGAVSLPDLVRLRCRHFSYGLALGSCEFLERTFEGNRQLFGPKRKTGSRPIRALSENARRKFSALRDLQVDVYG